MTAITFNISDTLSLEIKGHADYAAEGEDIVCSAVSILAYTLAEHIAILYEGGMLCDKPVIKMNSGDLKIECKPTKEALQNITNIFTFVELGFALIANTYPDNVKLNESSLR